MGNKFWWLLWGSLSAALLLYQAYALWLGENKQFFMPGAMSNGHHQLADKCEVCHGKAYDDGEVLQEACVSCHGDERKKPFDSHPREKFTDPRNADRLEKIDPLHCATCHVEHQPAMTPAMGLTQPADFCVHCHAEIAEDRPSHQDMPFNTCADAGCHNFHYNRSLYTDFLLKHLEDEDTKSGATLPARHFLEAVEQLENYPRERYPVEALNIEAQDAPPQVKADLGLQRDWLETAHAKAGVNCTACHEEQNAQGEKTWSDQPAQEKVCAQCHDLEVAGFFQGKHGMRVKQGLSPMTPAQARLPMQPEAAHKTLQCSSCHGAHRFETRPAAVESCLECHADQHSLNYKDSPHYRLWEAEINGTAPADSGVSCATCHMPRKEMEVNDWLERTVVLHNQSATLQPNEKMLRPVCLHCHGLGFSIDALADRALIERNFKGRPALHVKSLDMADADNQRYLKELEAARRTPSESE